MSRFGIWAFALTVVACLVVSPLSAAEYVVDQKSPAAADEGPGSAEKPFKTISKAVANLQPGDHVLIKAGVYCEIVTVKAVGTADKPIVIEGAPGEKVVISGGEEIKGWKKATKEEARGNPNWEHLYVAELDKAPAGLFQSNQAFLASRWPAFERLAVEGGDGNSVIDSKNLTQPAGQWEGGTLVVRVDKIGSYFRSPIVKHDAQKHELLAATLAKTPRGDIDPAKDTYWIEAAVAAIAEPGEYALDARAKPVKVYLWPQKEADPAKQSVEVRSRGPFCVTWGPGTSFVTFRNLEVCYSTGSGIGADGKTAAGAHDITIDYCLGQHNTRGGCSLDGQEKITVRRSLFCRNSFGVVSSRVKDVTIEECCILGNDEDGVVFSWGARDVRLVRSTIADHWWDSHPDNFQVYRDVTNLTIDSCLFFDGGQGFMLAEANRAKITNNMIVGTHITGVVVGHNSVSDYEFDHNTVAFAGLTPVSSSGTRLVLKNNVITPGADRRQVLIGKPSSIVDYNLFYKVPGGEGEDKFGQPNTHSKYEAPKFRCAPPEMRSFIIMRWGEAAKRILAKNTPGKFYLQNDKPVSDHFAVGDWVEVNYDGVPRKVTEVSADFVAFDPPIRKLHHWFSDTIVNWRDRKDFAWDLRLADGSPGKGMAEGGGDVGSNIDMQAYLKGDFNGDGKRDVPPLPENYDRRR